MEKDEKALLEELKFFDINNLYQKGSYIDFNIQNFWTQAYILNVHPNNKYDISFLYHPNDTKDVPEVSENFLSFFGEHSYQNDFGSRNVYFNRDLFIMDSKQIIQKLKLKLKKSNLDFDFDKKEKKKSKNIEKDEKNIKPVTNDNNKNDDKKSEQIKINEINNTKDNNNEKEKNNSGNKNEIKENNLNSQNDKTKEQKIDENNNNTQNNNEKNENNISKEQQHDENKSATPPTSIETPVKSSSGKKEEESPINNTKEKNLNESPDSNTLESKSNEKSKIILNSLTKLDKNGKQINISGYYTFQLLGGYLIDCSVFINEEISTKYLNPSVKDLLELCLDTIIFIAKKTKENMNKLKSLATNRKLIIVSQIHAILASFELVLNNFHDYYQYNLSSYKDIDEKFKLFANICYSILIESKEISALPLKLLINLIKFLADRNVNCVIEDYDENNVYKVFLSHIENLSENELKNIKSNQFIKKKCITTISYIFKKPKNIYISTCYNSYLMNCLKCNNLEKKMNALNDISEIIESNSREELDQNFYDFFIKKNKILDIFFEESVHEEILKRASCIFKYLASFNKLDNEILDKLIQEQKNDAMRSILCDVISELPIDKKNLIFNHLIKNLNFDEKSTDIEYISKLTEACLEDESYQKLLEQLKKKQIQDIYEEEEDEEIKEDLDKKSSQNYYGLTLLFDYIIKNFNEKKPYEKNNVNLAVESFNRIIQYNNYIEVKDIFYFLDLIFDNIKNNEKHNSVIQSINMIKKLLTKLYETNSKEFVIKKMNEKYDIISLIVTDLIRYTNLIQNIEKDKIDDNKIYEGIYPHKINIEERLDIIFIFNHFKQSGIKLDTDNLIKLYKLFNPKIFKKELQKLLNIFTKNLRFIENETIESFYKNILLNKEEFDLVNFEDLNTYALIKDIFYKINHNNKTLKGAEKKLRVINQNIEGLDFLFDILINNKNKFIQMEISNLLCGLCLNLYDYKTNFAQNYWKFFIDKIEKILVDLDKENNLDKLNGIINLIDKIYSESCEFEGVIPIKEDVHQIEDNHEVFQIHCDKKTHKDYKIIVGYDDTVYLMRWKCGYYFDIHVNNVVLMDKNNKKYSLINDNDKFFDIFPPAIYSPENGKKTYLKVNVIEEKDILLSIPGNPKILIEENENLLKILIKNLSVENKLENDIKQKIYNIIKKMPKELFIEQNIKTFGKKEKVSNDILYNYLNYDNIYVLSYFLQCFDFYINGNKTKNDVKELDEKNEILSNFIEIQNGEELLIKLLLNAKIDYKNISYIQIECITNLINLINVINKFKNEKNINKKNFEYIHNNISIDELIKKLSKLIINILRIRYDQINNYNYTSNISSKLIIDDSCGLLEKIIHFIDDINSDNKTYYLGYLLSTKELFKDIFLYKYMECKEEKLIEILHTYFIKNIFEDQNLLKTYLEIMFATDIFKYLIENDTNGNYFRMLTSIMQKFNLINLENKDNKKFCKNKDNKENKDKDNENDKEKKKENIQKLDNNKNKDRDSEEKLDKEGKKNINKDEKDRENEKNSEKEKKDKEDKDKENKDKDAKEKLDKEKENKEKDEKDKENKEKDDKGKENKEKDKNEKEGKDKEDKDKKNKEKNENEKEEKDKENKDKKNKEEKEVEGKNEKEESNKNKESEENIEEENNIKSKEKIEKEGEENKNDKKEEFKENSPKKINNENISDQKEETEDSKNDKYISQFKTIIDLIIEHIKQLCDEDINSNIEETDLSIKNEIKSQTSIYSDDFLLKKMQNEIIKNNKIEGIVNFLQSILNLYKEELINYFLSKVDIIDLFLDKCFFSKCNINSLDSKFPICSHSSSQDSIFHLIIFVLDNIPQENNLYIDVLEKLSKYHNIGFWKTNSLKNWELDTSEISKQKYIGLKNLSSTCYMNSILQQIFMIPMLRETILSIKNVKEKTVLFELQLLFSALKVYESQYYDPSSFVYANKLNFYEQMDADEYFGIFIDKIESDIKNLYQNESNNKYKDLFRFFFGIKALDELKFVDCNHKRYNEFFYNNIQLEVKGFNNLDSSLKNYFKTEIMDGENKINCEECHMKRTCHKRQIFKSLPNILVINLKRFEFDYNTMLKSKLNNYFEFPFELDMNDYLIEDHKEINTKYELTGITIHFGFSDCGHYYDLIKSPDGKWYKFNDNYVYEFDEKDIPHEAFGEKENMEDYIKDMEEKDNGQNNAYILIYKKVNFDEDTIDNISKNYICDLASPPYNKFSNINEKIKNIINIKMFKFWTIQSIVSPAYQHFVLNLLRYDLAKNKNKYNNKIFEFGLIYFYSVEIRVIFRAKEKSFLSEFVDIISIYIQRDVKKAKYLLEEFSNNEVIYEYLISCPTKSGIQAICQIIFNSFKKIFDYILLNQKSNKSNNDITEYNSFLFKFINTYVLYITYNIKSISIESVNLIFYKIISISEVFVNYLKSKNLEKWVNTFYNSDDDDEEEDDEEVYLNSILNEKYFPKIKSDHKILVEKKLEFDGTKILDDDSENELDKFFNNNRNRDLNGNMELIRKLYFAFKASD